GRSIVIALSVVYFPRIARVTRGIALSVLTQEYVVATRALGAPFGRLLRRTVLPNCLSVVIVQCSLYFAEVLLAEAALSFLGLGGRRGGTCSTRRKRTCGTRRGSPSSRGPPSRSRCSASTSSATPSATPWTPASGRRPATPAACAHLTPTLSLPRGGRGRRNP